MLQDSSVWNVKLIKFIFIPHEAKMIINIPLRARRLDDVLVWHHTSDGKFLVKSAYHLT